MKCKYCKEEHKNENTGCYNSGYRNSGDRNSGDKNSGDRNSGDWNSGDRNSGDRNSGDRNSGYMNSGDMNSGDWNSGNRNSGDRNSGYMNSGDMNSGDRNNGFFNTGEPNKIMVFNQWLDMKPSEFLEKYNIYADLPLNRWINKEDMSTEEKKEVSGWEEMGGYLKTLEFKESCKVWWNENEDRHDDFINLPNFNIDTFKEITGIDTEEKEEKVTIKISKKSLEALKESGIEIVE